MCLNLDTKQPSPTATSRRWSSRQLPVGTRLPGGHKAQGATRWQKTRPSKEVAKAKTPQSRARSATFPGASKQQPSHALKLSSPSALRIARGPDWCRPFSRGLPVVATEEPKSELCHWCLHEACLTSSETFNSARALSIHTAKQHGDVSVKKKKRQRKKIADRVDSDSGYSGSDTECSHKPVEIDFNAIMGDLRHHGIRL